MKKQGYEKSWRSEAKDNKFFVEKVFTGRYPKRCHDIEECMTFIINRLTQSQINFWFDHDGFKFTPEKEKLLDDACQRYKIKKENLLKIMCLDDKE